jgi:uncharacterized repeat protein (TIGR03943 family)
VRRWDRARLAEAAALGAWAGCFWFLWATGRTSLFLSGRTAWLVPLGAGLATAGAAGAAIAARSTSHDGVAVGPIRMGLVVLPVLIVLTMPPVTLGSYAVARRSSFGGVAGAVTVDDFEHGPLTMIHVAAAQTSDEDLARLRARAGEEVTFQGFVTRTADAPADEFLLTRFVITCCVADATTAQVRVVAAPPDRFADGDWVEVRGRIYPLGDEIVLAAAAVDPIAAPASPYLTAF